MKKILIVSILAGAVLGLASAHTRLISSWIAVVPWSVVGITLGLLCGSRRQSLWAGLAYGFFLCAAFLYGGFNGDSIIKFVPMLIILSLFGALCGLILSFIGFTLKRKKSQSV